jgi:hypothetical protein
VNGPGERRARRGKRDSETKAAVRERGSLVLGILLDTLVSVVLIGCRWVLLHALSFLTPEEQKSWTIIWFTWISDAGLIVTALAFFAFGVGKLLVRGWKSFRETMRE